MSERTSTALRATLALLATVAMAASIAVLAHLALGSVTGQALDQLVLGEARTTDSPLTGVVFRALETVTVPVMIAVLAIGAVIALVRRRPGLLVLKALLERTDLTDGVDTTANSYPSGHTTLAASVAFALVIVMPRRLRPPVAILGALWVSAAGLGTIASSWHRPSDVLGALFVAAGWCFALLGLDALIARAEPGAPLVGRSDLVAIVLLLLVSVPAVIFALYSLADIAALFGTRDLEDITATTSADTAQDAHRAVMLLVAGTMGNLTAMALTLRPADVSGVRDVQRDQEHDGEAGRGIDGLSGRDPAGSPAPPGAKSRTLPGDDRVP
jgi:membrane-associated phospholipid phosphatase